MMMVSLKLLKLLLKNQIGLIHLKIARCINFYTYMDFFNGWISRIYTQLYIKGNLSQVL